LDRGRCDLGRRGRSDQMGHFVGLDVSVKETSVCVVDAAGRVILEQKVPTEPADIVTLLSSLGVSFCRIGIEAGPLSQWLVNALTEADLPVICVERRHMKALLTAQQINKTDRNDARGIARMMRVGLFKPVHVKTRVAQEQRMLLTSRKLLQRKLLDLECDLRGTLRNFGLKVGIVSGGRYEARVRELVTDFPRLAAIVGSLLNVRRVMRQQFAVLHKMLLDTVRDDPGVPTADDRPRGRRRRRADLPCDGRSAATLCSFPGGRRACRPDAEALPVGRGRLRRRGVQMWRRPAAHDALRGRTLPAYPQREMVMAEGVGYTGGPAAWDASSRRCGRPPPGRGSAPDVLRLSELAAEKLPARRTGSASAERCPHGDDGWGEFVRSADPAADQRQGRPKDCTAPLFSSHHEAAWR